MRLLKLGTIPLPEIMVVSTETEVKTCKESGVPYIKWNKDYQSLVSIVFLPYLKDKFPHIKWEAMLKLTPAMLDKELIAHVPGGEAGNGLTDGNYSLKDENGSTHDVATEYRFFEGGLTSIPEATEDIDLTQLVRESGASVNIEQLEELGLLPSFLGEITDCIKRNLDDYYWEEGYNKKLGVPIGTFGPTSQAPNLMVLDISGSIPRGVSATMIALIDTLRERAMADLIITASVSKFYPYGTKLPDPGLIRSQFNYGNEAEMYRDILLEEIANKHYGNIISFGDYDSPCLRDFKIPGFRADELWNYHTTNSRTTGYAQVFKESCPEIKEHFNTSWTKWMDD